MSRRYWLDLFTGKTWEEFKKHGASVSGFRRRRAKLAKQIQPGDYLLCYITGISRFVGVLEIKSESRDTTQIWEDADFPLRFDVQVKYELTPKTGIPVLTLKDKLSLFQNLVSEHAWTGFFRGSPALFDTKDGEAIVEAIRLATTNPVEQEYEEAKYWRRPKTFESKKVGAVTVPEDKEEPKQKEVAEVSNSGELTHDEIQWLLLNLGSNLGLDVWVARNDRNRVLNGKSFSDVKNLKTQLPRQFDEATNRTIELIDVLWLQGDAILAAFEVEHTTSIYSGLLRMSDLITMQPNIKINLYLVAPDDRREKVFSEINRPTFVKLKPSLPKICKFIPYTELSKKVKDIGPMIKYVKAEFIDEIAESCEPDED
jgi:hypothetical protein